jgi:cytochrome P450
MTITPTCPVSTDFRFVGTGTFPQGFQRYDELQDQGPVVRVEEPGGCYWVVLDRELGIQCLQNPDTFSSAAITPLDPDPAVRMIPVQLDPPEHAKWRSLLASYFAPRRMPYLEGKISERCTELLDDIVARGSCDFLQDFAMKFPTTVFLEIVGLPVEELPQFQEWLGAMVHPDDEGNLDRDTLITTMFTVMGRLQEVVAERRAAPNPDAQDIISHAATWVVDGEPAKDDDILSCLLLLFLAGLDTVANELAYAMLHLSTHPEDRAKLAADPSKAPTAVEELLRAFSIPEVARKVTRDTELAGQRISAGDMVLFPLMAMNRDTKHVECARNVVLERHEPPLHYAFGAGPHRCLGSHLARQEMSVFLQMWHQRIPEYWLDTEEPIREHWGSIHGMKHLPLRWTPR